MNFNDYTVNMITWSVIRDLRTLSLDCKPQNTKPITTPLAVHTAIFGSPEIIQTLNFHTKSPKTTKVHFFKVLFQTLNN